MYSDGTRKASSQSGGDKLHKALLYFTSLLAFALLITVIWLGVENRHRKDDIDALRKYIQGSGQSSTATLNGVSSTSSSSSSSSKTNAYPSIYLSQNATAQNGYTFSGSLYRGSGYWAQQPPLDTPRADFVMLNLNETLFVFGGHDENGTYLAGGEKWQVLANETNSTAAMPQARSNFGAGAVGNQTVRIVGGYATLANKTNNTPERCDLVYNVTGDSWTTGACLNQSRGNHCTVVVNGKLFAIGGKGTSGTVLDSIEVYQPSSNSWSSFAKLPSGRFSLGCAASNNNIIIAGGTLGNGTDLGEVWAIDSNKANLSRLADLPEPKFGLSLVSLPDGDVLSVAGGQHINNSQIGTHGTERYSVLANQWVEKAQISNQRFGFGAAYADEGVYTVGGHTYCDSTSNQDCDNKLLTATEIFYDSDHPDVFVYIQNPAASLTGPAPNSSKVLLLNSQPAVNGYTNAGSLYRGSGYWAQGPSLPQPLSDLNVVGNGDLVYVIGGLATDGPTVVDTLYEYDPVTDTYRNLSNLPEPRFRGAADILGGLLYYTGGINSFNESDGPTTSTLVYNISANTWSTSNATLAVATSDLCMAAVNGSLYVAGGYDANYSILNLAQKYDPNSDAWVNITSMPTPRGDVMCSALEGQFVVAGGFYDPTGKFTPASFRTEVQAYQPSSGDWLSLASLPVARGDAAMTTVPSQFGDRLIVVGGENQLDNNRTGIATHQVQEYSSALDEWVLKAPMITPRFRHDVAYSEGHVVVFGGASSSLCPPNGTDCTLRPVATVDEFFDTDDPDVFVYLAN